MRNQAFKRVSGNPAKNHVKTLIAVGAFAFAICLFGGSSRSDAAQLIFLRPLACLFAGYAFFNLNSHRASELKPLYWGIGLLGALMTVQLIPLPFQIWSLLPGRDAIANLDNAAGLLDSWRPLTFSLSRTANSLASLTVPLAALLIFQIYPKDRRQDFFTIIIIIATCNSILGILQILGPSGGVLYFYEHTNPSEAVGFFANRNHSSVFAGLSLLVIAYSYTLNAVFSGMDPRYRNILLVSSGLIIFLSIIVNGSRTGFLCGGLALFTSLMILYSRAEIMKRRPALQAHKLGSVMIAVLGFLLSGFLVFLFFASDRLPAFSRVIEMDGMADLRARAMPTLFEMIGTYWPFGAGFGTFDKLYYIHEPNELLMPSYFNQAHNDWLQIIIEGGALAAIMILAGLIWYISSVYKLYAASSKNPTHLLFWLGCLAILSIASAVDYPVRTPIFSAVIIWLLALLSDGRKAYPPNSREMT